MIAGNYEDKLVEGGGEKETWPMVEVFNHAYISSMHQSVGMRK